jgi:ABC-type thiamin/hydroxymethylpyrimidine transport system permease subunit
MVKYVVNNVERSEIMIIKVLCIVIGVIYLIYSIYNRNNPNIYNRRCKMFFLHKEHFLRYQLYISIIVSLASIMLGIILIIYDFSYYYAYISPFLIVLSNYILYSPVIYKSR